MFKVGDKVAHRLDVWNKRNEYGVGTIVAADKAFLGHWLVDFPSRTYYGPSSDRSVTASVFMQEWLEKV